MVVQFWNAIIQTITSPMPIVHHMIIKSDGMLLDMELPILLSHISIIGRVIIQMVPLSLKH